jgi:hydrogenase nickel incorporation protein HypA/HybF
MHEISVARSIIEIVRQQLAGTSDGDVKVVRVRLGTLAGVVPESLEFSYGALTAGTRLEGSRLEVLTVPAQARCRNCLAEFELDEETFTCIACGTGGPEILSGREMQVVEIELGE